MPREIKRMALNTWRRYDNRYGRVQCEDCKKKINPGDEYVPRYVSGNYRYPDGEEKRTPIYCVKCATELYIL